MKSLKRMLMISCIFLFVSCGNDDLQDIPLLTAKIVAYDQQLSEDGYLVVEKVEVTTDAWIVAHKVLFDPAQYPDGYSEVISEPVLVKGSMSELNIYMENQNNLELDGATIALMLHKDDGDGIFEGTMENDKAHFIDSEGKPVITLIDIRSTN